MAVTTRANRVTAVKSADQSRVMGWKAFPVVVGGIAVVFIGLRVYQQWAAWHHGMDAALPDYSTYWMRLMYLELGVIGAGAIFWWGRILTTRCKVCETQLATKGEVDLAHEEKHHQVLWTLLAGAGLALFFMGSYYVSNDLSWHQTTVRDTAFTPTHVILFYGAFPTGLVLAVGSYLYARTRLPQVWGADKGVPLSFLMLMSAYALLMAQVAFNEWSHSLWITEERTATPFHWVFVFYAYIAVSFFAIWQELAGRYLERKGRELPAVEAGRSAA